MATGGQLDPACSLIMAEAGQETYAYAKTMLDVATAGADGGGRALIVGGGISNFTDVAATFKGIIQARLLGGAWGG